MPLEIKKTTDNKTKPAIRMAVYGAPGTGKTSFASQAEDVLIADCEHGAGLLGMRGISADVVNIEKWEDMNDLYQLMLQGKHKTLVLDPLGELLDKLLTYLKNSGHSTKDGALSLQGWGLAKDKFRMMLRSFRDMNINIVMVMHTTEKKDEEGILIRPKMQASLDEDVCAMMDVVGYLKMVKVEKKPVHRLFVQPSDKFYAKDRTGTLPEHLDEATFDMVKEKISASPFFASTTPDITKEQLPF